MYINKYQTLYRSYFTCRMVLNKMAMLYLFLIVIGLAYTSLSTFKNEDLVSQMIAEQRRTCPYIALCNTPNSSVFERDFKGFFSPCCKECSCHDTCVEDGSCCPDYITKDNSVKTEQPHESTTELVAKTKECVKIQHGHIQNQMGFMMVATCPSSYDDIIVKKKCEVKLEYFPFDLFDHVPVTDTDRGGQIYKNRYCGQCNMPKDSSVTLWRTLLTCQMDFFQFNNVFPIKDLSSFIEAVIFDGGHKCNIVFEHETTHISVNDTPTVCAYNTVIDTCDKYNSNDYLKTLCKKYTWPIEAFIWPESRLYKNYACMLCNGVSFEERCRKLTDIQPVTIQFTLDFNNTQKLTRTSNESGVEQQIINRYFPSKVGEVHCKMGFVYDVRKKDSIDRCCVRSVRSTCLVTDVSSCLWGKMFHGIYTSGNKRMCRLVLCPQYFIIIDGECVPLFRKLDGVDYCMLLQADVTSVTKEPTKELDVATLTKEFYNIFREHLGDELIEFSILRNQNLLVKDRYFVQIIVSGNLSQGRYISILNFTNNIIQRTISFNNNLSVVFSFNITTALIMDCRLSRHQFTETGNDKFLLVKSYKRNGKDVSENWKAPLYISPALLCYRIALSENEVKRIGFVYISVFNNKIHSQNFQMHVMEKRVFYIVCLDQGLQNVEGTINIFLKEKSTDYTFISKQKVTELKKKTPKTTTGENKDEDLNKSLFATIATVAFIAFIVILRRIMKHVTEKMQTNIAEYVSETDVQITESNSENLNEEDAIVVRKEMHAEVLEP